MKKKVVSILLVILCGALFWGERTEAVNYDSEIALQFKEDVKGKSKTSNTTSKTNETNKKNEEKSYPNTASGFFPKTGSVVNTLFVIIGLIVALVSITLLIFRFRHISKKR
ncbi:LPXTG cell wall anchor domain-containing protein [Candidatus Enterococcus mansonii]|uniref:Gram-positive cocci surface proteins LPxTG domain-containing protein n=1 Tax=Candidatus Enterococcus mansonii TaxID=1834181 RepID=A0ABU8IJ59_9ENTE